MYIGSTVDFYDRKAKHLNKLRKNIHHSIKLQNAFNKYKINSFDFNILCYLFGYNKRQRLNLEDRFLEIYKPEYNCSKTASCITMSKKGLISSKRKHSKKWVIIYPNGKKEIIINLREFCKINGLFSGGMSAVISGKMTYYKGYKCYEYGKSPKIYKSKRKKWIVMFPNGHEILVEKPAEFCKIHNLNLKSMYHVIKGYVSNYKGYKCKFDFEKEYRYKDKKYIHIDSACRNYLITFPDGTQITIRNLAQFCRDQKLNKCTMYALANNNYVNNVYKGFKCEKV